MLDTKSMDTILPGETKSFSFTISNNELDSAVSEEPCSYYLLLETNTIEANTGNNGKTIYLYPDFTIDLIAGIGGSVTGNGTYANGETVTLVATPNQGYIFEGWYEDGQCLYEISEEYIVTVDSNRTLEARFKKNDLKITNIETFGSATAGETITFTATATGGIQPWQWEFYVKKNDVIVYANDTSTVNFFDWTPQEPGTYSILVYVTDATGRQVSHTISITIT